MTGKAFPRIEERRVWICSDGLEFQDQDPADEHERLLSKKAQMTDAIRRHYETEAAK